MPQDTHVLPTYTKKSAPPRRQYFNAMPTPAPTVPVTRPLTCTSDRMGSKHPTQGYCPTRAQTRQRHNPQLIGPLSPPENARRVKPSGFDQGNYQYLTLALNVDGQHELDHEPYQQHENRRERRTPAYRRRRQ